MLNWIVWNRSDYLMDLALNNLQRWICHKHNQPSSRLHGVCVWGAQLFAAFTQNGCCNFWPSSYHCVSPPTDFLYQFSIPRPLPWLFRLNLFGQSPIYYWYISVLTRCYPNLNFKNPAFTFPFDSTFGPFSLSLSRTSFSCMSFLFPLVNQ